jgi:hypothetical protein
MVTLSAAHYRSDAGKLSEALSDDLKSSVSLTPQSSLPVFLTIICAGFPKLSNDLFPYTLQQNFQELLFLPLGLVLLLKCAVLSGGLPLFISACIVTTIIASIYIYISHPKWWY